MLMTMTEELRCLSILHVIRYIVQSVCGPSILFGAVDAVFWGGSALRWWWWVRIVRVAGGAIQAWRASWLDVVNRTISNIAPAMYAPLRQNYDYYHDYGTPTRRGDKIDRAIVIEDVRVGSVIRLFHQHHHHHHHPSSFIIHYSCVNLPLQLLYLHFQ